MFSKDCMHSSGKADRCLSGSVGTLSVATVAPAVNMLSKLWAWLRCEMAPPSFVLPSAVYRIHTSYSLLQTPFLFCGCWSFPSPPSLLALPYILLLLSLAFLSHLLLVPLINATALHPLVLTAYQRVREHITSNTVAVSSILWLAGGSRNVVFVQTMLALGLCEGTVGTFCHLITNLINEQRHLVRELFQVQVVQGPENPRDLTEDAAVEDDKVLINHGYDRVRHCSTVAGKVFVAQTLLFHLR